MDLDTLQSFQNETICSTCMNHYLDPVTIDCGHTVAVPACASAGKNPKPNVLP